MREYGPMAWFVLAFYVTGVEFCQLEKSFCAQCLGILHQTLWCRMCHPCVVPLETYRHSRLLG
jgi:hypothetical protein